MPEALKSGGIPLNGLNVTRKDVSGTLPLVVKGTSLNQIHNIMAGDWSNDGHGITHSTIIRSNFTKDQIKESYQAGVQIVGFDLKEDTCRKYEDDLLGADCIKKLNDNGINLELEGDWEGADTSEGIHVNPEEYTEIFLSICKLGNKDFDYQIVDTPEVHIGGYGMFYG